MGFLTEDLSLYPPVLTEDPTEDLSPCRGSEPVPETVSAWVASFEDDKASGRPGWGS